MDVISNVFEVGQSATGVAAMATWIAAQKLAGTATNVVGTFSYTVDDQEYILVLMATALAKAGANVVGASVVATRTSIRNDGGAALQAWLNAAVIGTVAPAAPALSLITAGALTGQGTISVKVALVSPTGASAASPAAALAVTDAHELVVASPVADTAGTATGYNVYLGAAGSEKLQNVSPIALGTNFTLTTAPVTSGATASATNASAMKYIQHVSSFERSQDVIAAIVLSN